MAVEALWLYTLIHRLTMWTWLTRSGANFDGAGPTGLIRDLDEMLR